MLQFLLTSDLLAPLRLDTAPVGWQGLKYLFARDEHYHGITLTMTSELTFWKQAGAYLRTLYEGGTVDGGVTLAAQGVEAVAVLSVFEDDPNEFRTSEVYRGRVDFTQYKSSEKGVTVKLKELGFATNLLARADAAIDLFGNQSLSGHALPAHAPTAITLHSQALKLNYDARQAHTSSPATAQMTGDQNNPSRENTLYFGFDTTATNDLGVQAPNLGWVSGDVYQAVPIYTATGHETLTLDLALTVHVEAHNTGGPLFENVDGRFHLRLNQAPANAINLVPPIAVSGLTGNYTADFVIPPSHYTAKLSPGQSIWLYADFYIHSVGGGATTIRYQASLSATLGAGSFLRISAHSTTQPSGCRGLLVHEALTRLTEAMTDAPGGFYSEYYGRPDTYPAYAQDGPGALRLLTNGFGLRGFPLPTDAVALPADGTDPRKPFTAPFRAVYDSLNAIDCLGAGIEPRNGRQTLRIEPRAYFYQLTEVVALDGVQALTKAVHTPGLHNEVQVGYQHWQSGAQTGLDEFNGQRTYALPLTQVKATYTALSTVNTAGYLIEQARRQLFTAGTTKEGAADNELFLISLRRSGTAGALVTERDEAFSLVKGVLDPASTYNLRLSPGRNLRRHGAWIRAGLVPQAAAGQQLRRTAVLGNDKLTTRLATEATALDEHADVVLQALSAPLIVAELYEFTAALRRAQVRALTQNPYGLISFLDGQGQRKRGYLLKLECEPASGKASFTLLRAATP